MMNLLALCLVFTSVLAAELWSPSPVANQPQKQQVEDVIEKEGHRVVVVETYEENGHHNTKVSISPEQPQPQQRQQQDGGVKFKSPSLVEKAKAKMEDAADYVRPNIGQGISHGSGAEKHYPTELVCDGLGKCTHKMAKVLHKAADKVSEVVHDAVDKKIETGYEAKEGVEDLYKKQKEMVHGTKDKVEGLYEKAKETASEKAHEAKEFVEDAYEKVKQKTAEKAHDAKECAQESKKKAKGAVKEAKDLGKTIKEDVAHNITEAAEEVVEETKAVKESTKHAPKRIGTFVNHAKRYISEAVTSLMGVVNLLGFGIAYGMCVWVTFISSYVLARVLPRQQFGIVQSKIYPVYFRAMAYSIGLALSGHLLVQRRRLFTNKAEMFQAYNLLTSILVVLVNLLYLEPLAKKAMFERMKIEKEEGRGRESPTAESSEARYEQPVTDPSGPTTTTTTSKDRAEETTTTPAQENQEKEEIRSRIRTMSKRLKTLNSYSSFLNILTLMALTWHLIYLGQRLHLPVAC